MTLVKTTTARPSLSINLLVYIRRYVKFRRLLMISNFPLDVLQDIRCGAGEVCEMQERVPQCHCPPGAHPCPCPALPSTQVPTCVPRHGACLFQIWEQI